LERVEFGVPLSREGLLMRFKRVKYLLELLVEVDEVLKNP
jgi:hypothetical protein